MRTPSEDPIARTVAENELADHHLDGEQARQTLAYWPHVEFEKTTRKVQGQDLYLRRVVITGKWEIDPNATR